MALLEELFAGPLPNQSYLDRLANATFTSPSGVTFEFKYDELSREGAKKLSISEILDSDKSITQDQGNKAIIYPMSIYFSGKDYDLVADQFWIALSENYSIDDPGILNNPRWGRIQVFPMTFKQSENFVSGSRIGRFDVSFVRVYPGDAPEPQEASLKGTQNIADKIKAATEDIFDNVILSSVRDISDFTGRISNAFGVVSGFIGGLVSSQQSLIDEIENITAGFNSISDDVANNSYLLVSQTQRMMELPSKLRDDTLQRLNRFRDLYYSLVESGQVDPSQSTNIRKNSLILMESIAGYANAQLVVSSLNTEYQTRAEALQAISTILETYNDFIENINDNSISGLVDEIYYGDHNFLSNLADLNKQAIALLLSVSFDLDAEKRIVLKNASDPISLCYQYYKNVDSDTIEFFANTNYLTGDEFIEIPAGREIVVYG